MKTDDGTALSATARSRSDIGYFLTMALSAVLTLARGFIVALLLDVAGFGAYALAVAVGAWVSGAVSLGRVEATLKSFPRLWHAGRANETASRSDGIARALTIRVLLLTIAGTVVGFFSPHESSVSLALSIAGFAIASALTTVYASALRASGWLQGLSLSNVLRAASALLLASCGAWGLSWPGAILGEIVAAVGGALLMRALARKQAQSAISERKIASPAMVGTARDAGGVWLYWAQLLATAPYYLDRLFVASVFGVAAAGSYAFLMLMSVAAVTMIGIIVQKVGPELIRMEQDGLGPRVQVRLVVQWCVAAVLLFVTGGAVAAVALLYWPFSWLGAKYGVTLTTVALVAGLSALHITAVVDWLLISRDCERQVFVTALVYVVGCFVAALATVWLNESMAFLIACLVIAKLAQLALQAAVIVGKVIQAAVTT